MMDCVYILGPARLGSSNYVVPAIDVMKQNSRFECFTASKGSNNYFYLLLLQLVLCRVAALKSLPVHHP